MVVHPFPSPVDHRNVICPIYGELRFGFSLVQIDKERQRVADIFSDPDVPDGAELYRVPVSPTCGTIKTWYKKGVNDGQDGLPAIIRIELDHAEIPSFGSRRLARKLNDQLAIGSTATDVAELSVEVKADQHIRFRAWLVVKTSATTIAAMVSVNGPAASFVMFETRAWTSATVSVIGGALSLDTFSTLTSGNGATPKVYYVEGVCVFTAAGTFTPRIKAEAAGTCDVLAGSNMVYDLI